jgi:hypothetical protein
VLSVHDTATGTIAAAVAAAAAALLAVLLLLVVTRRALQHLLLHLWACHCAWLNMLVLPGSSHVTHVTAYAMVNSRCESCGPGCDQLRGRTSFLVFH